MADWKIATDRVMEFEGWIIENDLLDSGGETCCGIDRTSHGKWPGWKIIKDMRACMVSDKDIVKTDRIKDEVYKYYKERFEGLLLNEIEDQKKSNQVFQLCINIGDFGGMRLIQEVVVVKIDGVCGPQTIAAINHAIPSLFYRAVCERQKLFYKRTVEKKNSQNRFLAGWYRRAEAFA